MDNKAKIFMGLGVLSLVGYALLSAQKPAVPVGVYQSGPVILKVTKKYNYGFSYEIWIGGVRIFTDTIYAGDDEYLVPTSDPNYTISYFTVNDQPTLIVYDADENQVNPNAFNLYWNGTAI